jgi:hypothetical protein
MRRRLLLARSEVWPRLGSVIQLGRMVGGSSCVCCLARRSLECCLGLGELLCLAFWSGAVVLTES